MPSGMDERWFNYNFDSGSVHDVPRGLVETSKLEANDNVVTGRALPSCQVSWVVPAERCGTFDEPKALRRIEGNAHEEDITPPENVMEDIIDVEADEEDD